MNAKHTIVRFNDYPAVKPYHFVADEHSTIWLFWLEDLPVELWRFLKRGAKHGKSVEISKRDGLGKLTKAKGSIDSFTDMDTKRFMVSVAINWISA